MQVPDIHPSASGEPNVAVASNRASSQFAGSWKVTYSNGAIRHYQIDEDGRVSWGTRSAIIEQRGPAFIIDFKDNKLERIKRAGDQIHIDHYDPPGAIQPSCTGVAIVVKAHETVQERGGAPARKPRKDSQPLKDRLAGSRWKNTNGFTFEWDTKGTVWQGRDGDRWQVKVVYVDGNRCTITFPNDVTQVFVFDDDMQGFRQYGEDGQVTTTARRLFAPDTLAKGNQSPKSDGRRSSARNTTKKAAYQVWEMRIENEPPFKLKLFADGTTCRFEDRNPNPAFKSELVRGRLVLHWPEGRTGGLLVSTDGLQMVGLMEHGDRIVGDLIGTNSDTK